MGLGWGSAWALGIFHWLGRYKKSEESHTMRDGARRRNERKNRAMQLGIRVSMGKLVWKARSHLAEALSLCSCSSPCHMIAPWEKSPMNLTWEMLPKGILLKAVSSWISITEYTRLDYSQIADIRS